MQLKMTNRFDVKSAKQMLQEENRFISDLFEKMPVPMSELGENIEEAQIEVKTNTQAKVLESKGKATRAHTFEELRQKLGELKGQKKLNHKQKLVKKSLKNRIKKKSKREERHMQKKLAKTEQNAGSVSKVKKEDEEEVHKVTKPKPVFNAEGNMVFSKFDFSDIGSNKKSSKSTKDLKKTLEQLQQKKEEVKELELAGETEKAQEIKEKGAWKAVLAKSSGEKIRDDPELLKRSIKRSAQQKLKSSKKWESRIEGVQKTKQEQQQKRQENILKRKKDKKLNKLKKASKKGRVIAGF